MPRTGGVIAERFAIEREAGAGGMGVVYLAHDQLTGARVALKMLHHATPTDADRFVREAEALAVLDHPSVVRYVAHGTTPAGELFLAMEWLEGEDLSARLVSKGLTIGETIQVVRQVADALAALHRRGVIHRDIKPSNVFLVGGDVGRIKLLDLGIARVSRAVTLTRAGALVGTPGYMAPEQARGQSDIGERVDLFALGCVLFECLTGKAAFHGETVMALLAKILVADAPRPREVRPEIPPGLDDLCVWMMCKEPGDRPDSAATVIAALDVLASDDAGAALPFRGAPRRTPALTTSEQRLVCVFLVGDARGENAPDESLAPTLSQGEVSAELTLMRARMASVGIRIEGLADGSILGMGVREGDASEQAVATARAALLMRAEMPTAAIAVATGRGDVSSPVPVGEVIDRAARLFRSSRRRSPPPIVVDDVTAGLISDRFEIGANTEGFRTLVAEHQDARVGARTVLGKETPFVGREREIAMLEGLFDECVEESSARAVLVTAGPGIGKSRLRREIVSRVVRAHPDASVWIGRGDPMLAGSPFSLLGATLRDGIGIAAAEDIDARRAKLRARVVAAGTGDPERVIAFIGEIASAAQEADRPDLAAARRDPQMMNDQLRSAWLTWLDAEARAHPLFVVLEDLQWGDAPTVSFVDDALRTLADRPLFVLAIARPEVTRVFPKLWGERSVQPLPLRELSKKASETLARHVLGASGTAELVSSVVARAGGNAFFLEELLRTAADSGVSGALPETVLAMVEARLDALDPDARRVLRAASVYGETFHAGGVVALLGEDSGVDVRAWLDVLTRSESIVARESSSIPDEPEFVFRHALVRDAAYAMLTDKDRKLGHLLAGTWLESKGASDAAVLATHFERGGARERAATWFSRAAQSGFASNDLDGVLALASRGLACADAPAERAALLVVSAEAHRWRGEYDLAKVDAHAAFALVPSGSDAWWDAIEKCVDAAAKLNDQGAVTHLIAEVEHAIDRIGPGRASLRIVTAVLAAAAARVEVGAYEGAGKLLDWARDRTADSLSSEPIASAIVAVARSHYDLVFGDVVSFCEQLMFAQRIYEDVGASRSTCRCMVGYAYGRMLLGQYVEAATALRRALALSLELGAMTGVMSAKHNLGFALMRTGQLDEALAIETEALDLARRQKNPRFEGACLYYLSLIAHARGSFDEAMRYAEESAKVCALVPPSRAEALAALAQARLSMGDAPGARHAAAEAMKILNDVGSIDEGEPFIRLMDAETLHAHGDGNASRRAIRDALAHLERRADKLGPDARATFFAVPEHARTVELARTWGA
jgi:tetratricopeptide (TPR) repeat protein